MARGDGDGVGGAEGTAARCRLDLGGWSAEVGSSADARESPGVGSCTLSDGSHRNGRSGVPGASQ